MKVDAHQHFWKIDRGDYGWLSSAQPRLWRDYLPEDLAPLLASEGIGATILVQAAPTVAETQFLLGLAREAPFVAGVVGWVDFDSPSAAKQIAAVAKEPGLVGLRPMVQDMPDPAWLARPELDAAFAAMVEASLCFDALVLPIHLPALEMRLRRTPDLRIVIDHGAKPSIAAGDILAWQASMRRIARETNARCKLSGMATEAGPDWNSQMLQPYCDALLDVFGPERILWGSDWPVLNEVGSYDRWVATTDALLANLSSSDRDWIWGRAAIDFYRLGATCGLE